MATREQNDVIIFIIEKKIVVKRLLQQKEFKRSLKTRWTEQAVKIKSRNKKWMDNKNYSWKELKVRVKQRRRHPIPNILQY